MPKPFQDVVPPNNAENNWPPRRSIREVPLPAKASVISKEEVEEEPVVKRETLEKFAPKKNKSYRSKIFGGLIFAAVLVFVFLMMNAFTSANIEISPKKETASFNLSLKAGSAENMATSSNLKYQVIPLSGVKEKEVPAAGEEQVSRKATAKVVIYNNFSAESQRLITRTRFQTPEGLIFRINDSVVVPGKKGEKLGTLEVTISADEPGEKYNIGLSDFTIPGFKDDPVRYKGFYARSVNKAVGGYIGKVKKINDADRKSALTEMKTGIEADLNKELLSKLDPNLVVLKGAILYDFKELPQTDSSGGAIIKEEGKASAIAFDKNDLSAFIKKEALKSWDTLPAQISSFDQISLAFDSPDWRPLKSDLVSVKISGTAPFTSLVDKAIIRERLVGKSKSELLNIINDSKAILSAKASVRPIWKGSFPSDANKIHITVNP